MAGLEKSNSKSKTKRTTKPKTKGGARPGAGRPKGKKSPQTIEREEAMRQFRERVANNITKLLNSQLDLAMGEKYLMVTRKVGKKEVTTIVTDPETIRRYLDGELDDADGEFYFMTTKPASNSALESLLNRTFGKVTDHVDINAKHTVEEIIVSDEQFEQLARARTKRNPS